MADAKPAYQWAEDASKYSERHSQSDDHSQSDELQSLREETKRLRELVVQLSKVAIKNAVNAK